MKGYGVKMQTIASVTRVSPPIRPLPDQMALLPVGSEVALTEYKAAFKNDSVHLPELSLRYLIFLVLSGADFDQIHSFVCSMRLELNGLCLERLKTEIASRNSGCAAEILTANTGTKL